MFTWVWTSPPGLSWRASTWIRLGPWPDSVCETSTYPVSGSPSPSEALVLFTAPVLVSKTCSSSISKLETSEGVGGKRPRFRCFQRRRSAGRGVSSFAGDCCWLGWIQASDRLDFRLRRSMGFPFIAAWPHAYLLLLSNVLRVIGGIAEEPI